MRKMIEVAALRLTLSIGAWSLATHAHAQDPEDGAVDLSETATPASETRSAPAWENPPGIKSDAEDEREPAPSEPEAKQEGPGKLRIFAGPRLGVGGGFRPKGRDFIYVAKPTPGAQLGAEYLLHKYFALGLETRLSWAAVKSSGDKFMIWDLCLKPRLQYRLKAAPLDVYLAAPGGLSVNKPSRSVVDAAGNTKKDTGKAGASVGLFAGASYFFNDSWALNAELGWTWTFLRYEGLYEQAAPPVPGLAAMQVQSEVKVTLSQLTLLALNITYAF